MARRERGYAPFTASQPADRGRRRALRHPRLRQDFREGDLRRGAGLTERYFYEAFPDRTGLLTVIYQEVIEDAYAKSAAAVAAADGLEAEIRDGLGLGLRGRSAT